MSPTRITKRELDEMLSIEFDWDARTAFLKLSREEQLMALLSAQAYLRGEVANVKKWQIDFQTDNKSYRKEREEHERNGDSVDVAGLTEKIAQGVQKALAQRFDVWVWLRDKVAPSLVSTAIMAIIILMGLIATGRFP